MKLNWIIKSAISGLIGGIITYALTSNWKISLVSSIVIFVLVILNNPNRRYMRAFYIALFPLLSSVYFNVTSKTENLDMRIGIKELGVAETIVLGLIAIICLILDWLERNGKLEGTIFAVRKNKVGDINGSNNQINQTNV